MRILKCYLANDASGRFVTADEAAKTPDGIWTCASCGCVLLLRAGFGEKPWFEHDQRTVSTNVLMQCTHFDPAVKASANQRKIRIMLAELEPIPQVVFWHCVWCGRDYDGDKKCTACGTGIYSTARRPGEQGVSKSFTSFPLDMEHHPVRN